MTGAKNEPRHSDADLSAFHAIARALTSALDLESVLTAIMGQMERFFRPEAWTLMLTDERRRDLYYALADERFGRRLSGVRVPFGEGASGLVAERGEILIVPDAVNQPETKIGFDTRLGLAVRSAFCIPLRSRLRTLGVIQLFNLPPEAFSEYGKSRLTVLSDFAAVAIENARAFERVQELTITDECTGLYNLRHFDNTLLQEMVRSERLSMPMSLIFIDLDHFKLVNDQYGHQVGSQLLAAVGATIKGQVRSIDLAFRYGGDEFIVLLPGTGKRKAAEVANRLLVTLRKTSHPIPPVLHLNVRASLGVSSYPDDGKSAQEILRAADARMYEIKGGARDGVSFTGKATLRGNQEGAADLGPSSF
ncbi:MAG TPA: sensor domain-containing diguanylate cyclase [Silvibacterium sp.]|nr:sensor domain-containing diguanylate cyclase [Silvibacterium sp.]